MGIRPQLEASEHLTKLSCHIHRKIPTGLLHTKDTPKVPGEGRVDATLWGMSDLEAEVLAVRIELLYEETKQRLGWPYG